MDLAVTPVADLGAMTMARPSREYLREALAAAFEGVLPVVARVRSGVGEFCHRRAQLSWIVIVGTVLEPLARSVDLHPVQFAIISIVSLAFGLVTPPYGLCLMIACSIAGVRLRYALKDTLIMLIPMLLVLAALIIWPNVSLFLPRLIVPEMLK